MFNISNHLSSPVSYASDVTSPESAVNTQSAPSVNQGAANLVDSPVILFQMKGADEMQQVGPKAPSTDTGSGSTTPSPTQDHFSECKDGALANGFSAIYSVAGSEAGPAYAPIAGEIGKDMGTAVCVGANDAWDLAGFAASMVGSLFKPAEDISGPQDQSKDGQGGMCTDPRPTGGQSAGTIGGYCKDPGSENSTPTDSYTDTETGERITNRGGVTIAGDPNASGTYIGEADDPNFTKDQNGTTSSTASTSSSSQGTNTDNSTQNNSTQSTDNSSQSTQQSDSTSSTSSTQETQQSSDPNGPKPNSGSMPADDGSGSTGPAGPRLNVFSQERFSGAENFYMPPDDSAGGGTPRSNVASTANVDAAVAFQNLVMSKSQLS